jgi:hypothetical protein
MAKPNYEIERISLSKLSLNFVEDSFLPDKNIPVTVAPSRAPSPSKMPFKITVLIRASEKLNA